MMVRSRCGYVGEIFISVYFFFSSRRRHTRSYGDWSSDVCSSDLDVHGGRPESAEDRREMEDHGFSYVALVSLDVCRTRSAANEQNKIFRTVPAQMNFLHDGGGHISIHDLSNDLRSPLAIDPQRLGNLVPDGLDC